MNVVTRTSDDGYRRHFSQRPEPDFGPVLLLVAALLLLGLLVFAWLLRRARRLETERRRLETETVEIGGALEVQVRKAW